MKKEPIEELMGVPINPGSPMASLTRAQRDAMAERGREAQALLHDLKELVAYLETKPGRLKVSG